VAFAVDTNIVVRLIVNDDGKQVAAIRRVMETTDLVVPLTVLLETEWVLRSRYGLARDRVADALLALTALEGIEVEQRHKVDWALARHRQGADLADMLHLIAAGPVDGFLTLDGGVKKRAGAGAPLAIRTVRAP
jgi:predicted nucleic-acid-binding protein